MSSTVHRERAGPGCSCPESLHRCQGQDGGSDHSPPVPPLPTRPFHSHFTPEGFVHVYPELLHLVLFIRKY